MTFYTRLQSTATKLLSEYAQGSISHIRDGEPTGPSYDPTPGQAVATPVTASVKGASARYVQDGFISAQDLELVCSVFGFDPVQSDRFSIDGRELQVIMVEPIPAAGTTVAWRVFLKS
jgi:hypothetical protein